jgi:hypothetical protein
MSRHRRQQRRRAGRALRGLTWEQAERFARALRDAPPIEPFETNAYEFRQAPAGLDAADALFGALGFRRVE